MRLLSSHRSSEAALTLHGENKTRGAVRARRRLQSRGTGFRWEGQSVVRKRLRAKPRRRTSPVKSDERALDPPHECDGNGTPQSWQGTSVMANGVREHTGIPFASQWQWGKGGVRPDWRGMQPTGNVQQVPVWHSRGKVGSFAHPLFTTHQVSADTDLGSDLLEYLILTEPTVCLDWSDSGERDSDRPRKSKWTAVSKVRELSGCGRILRPS